MEIGLPIWAESGVTVVRRGGCCDTVGAVTHITRSERSHWCMTPKSKKFFDGSLLPGRSTGRSFKTLSWDKPSHTVSYGHREVHVHPDCNRRISVHEALLLQGFPSDYDLLSSMSDQFSQVGEAVPPPLARGIALGIRKYLYGI